MTIYTTLIDNGKYTAVGYLPGGNSMIRAAFLSIISLIVLLAALSSLQSGYNKYYSTAYALNSSNKQQYVPILRYSNGTEAIAIRDRHLTVEVVAEGLNLPTTMAFLGPNDILVLEKQNGTVQRIVDGKMLPEPMLDVNVATQIERCMCGIAISHAKGPDNSTTTTPPTYVFLYYTEAAERDGGTPIGNRLYRYELVDNKLVNPTRLLNLPATPGPRHNGGAIIIGPDNNLYVPIGDVDGHKTQAQNFKNGPQPDGTGGILRITQGGRVLPDSPLGNTFPLNLYYAYGIRNSFGIAFDPVTGNLWDTENVALSHWEIKILKSITKETKSEKKIAKDIGLDVSTTSQLITRLMLNGFVDKINKQRRMRPSSYIEQFATTPEGLVELEDINRRSSSTFEQVMNLLKERGEEIFFSYSRRNDLPVKIPLHILKITYKFAKFILK